MELVLVSKEARLDPGAKRSLQEKLEYGRGVDDDQADSRSSRMTTKPASSKVTHRVPYRIPSFITVES
jgi:hypothetical protein